MIYANKFDNSCLGTYNVLIQATEDDMHRILEALGEPDAVPDCLPRRMNDAGEDLYLFLADTKRRFITPMWSVLYAYGSGYNGYGPIGEELPHFTQDWSSYRFRRFNDVDLAKIKNCSSREEWPDRVEAVFRPR